MNGLVFVNRLKRLPQLGHRLLIGWKRLRLLKQEAPRLEQAAAPAWMKEQIAADLAPFCKEDLTSEAIDRFLDTYDQKQNPWLLVRYKIQNNRLIQKTFGNYSIPSTRNMASLTAALQRLCRYFTLPEVDFVVSLHDALDRVKNPIPVFVFSKHSTEAPHNVLIPDFEALSLCHRFYPKRKNAQAPSIQKAIFRGAMTGGDFTLENFAHFPRSRAITASLQYPELIDARYTTICQTAEPDAIWAKYRDYFGLQLTIDKQLQYRYQLLIDGNSCAYSRALWQLIAGCVILKQDSENIQWYYGALHPYVHYVPVASDLSNLKEVIEWAQVHENEVEAIAKNAKQLAENCLAYDKIYQYLFVLLRHYGSLQSGRRLSV